MNAADKRLDQMNRLTDMGHFPARVNAGATLNVLLTITITWLLVPHYPQAYAPVLWIMPVLFLNLLPVVLLRLTITPDTQYPTLRTMSFVWDQHKFSDWVYVAASANMAFWVLSAWTRFALRYRPQRCLPCCSSRRSPPSRPFYSEGSTSRHPKQSKRTGVPPGTQ